MHEMQTIVTDDRDVCQSGRRSQCVRGYLVQPLPNHGLLLRF